MDEQGRPNIAVAWRCQVERQVDGTRCLPRSLLVHVQPNPPHGFRRVTFAALVPILLVSLGSSCRDCQCPPEVKSIEVVPGELYAQQGATFEVRALLRDGDDKVISEFYGYRPVWWSTAPQSLRLVRRSGHTAVFTATEATTLPITIWPTLTQDVVTRWATVTILANDPGSDHIHAQHQADAPLEAALIEHTQGAQYWLDDATVAFAGTGLLGALANSDGDVAIFSANTAMGLKMDFRWRPPPGPGVDEIDFTASGQRPGAPLDIPLVVWVVPGSGDNGMSNGAFARIQVADASNTFAANRAGVSFSIAEPVRPLTTEWAQSANACSEDVSGSLRNLGLAFNPESLNVFFVASITNYDAGWWCPPGPINGSEQGHRVFVSLADQTATTFAAELAHAFLGAHHANEFSGFDESNVLWREETDTLALARSHLSLGQVFRVNVDAYSWLNFELPGSQGSFRKQKLGGTPHARPCGPQPSSLHPSTAQTEPCPPLAKDLP